MKFLGGNFLYSWQVLTAMASEFVVVVGTRFPS